MVKATKRTRAMNRSPDRTLDHPLRAATGTADELAREEGGKGALLLVDDHGLDEGESLRARAALEGMGSTSAPTSGMVDADHKQALAWFLVAADLEVHAITPLDSRAAAVLDEVASFAVRARDEQEILVELADVPTEGGMELEGADLAAVLSIDPR